jgi:peptidoglycan/LPS O-acetylase OafA/YrhL
MENRLREIDGIRGWAALSVLLFHLFSEIFGVLVPGFRGDITYFLFNGGLAVTVFFILSGDALSAGYLRSGNLWSLDAMVIKRYFRLTVPILLSCLIAYLLMRFGLTFNVAASEIVHRREWLGSFLPFGPNLASMLRYSLYLVYDGHSVGNSYNPFLWTMSIELIGSMLVFLYLYLSDRIRHPFAVLSAIIAFLFVAGSFYCLFFIGLMFGKLRANGTFDRLRASREWRFAAVVLIAVIVVGDTRLRNAPKMLTHINIVVSAILVFCFYSMNWTVALFSSRLSRFMGDISFPLYLVHFGVLVSLTSFLIVRFHESGTLDAMHIWIVIVSSVVASIGAAAIFHQIEKRMLEVVNRLPSRLLAAGRTREVAQAEGILVKPAVGPSVMPGMQGNAE